MRYFGDTKSVCGDTKSVCVGALHPSQQLPSQQLFSHFRMISCLPGLNQY